MIQAPPLASGDGFLDRDRAMGLLALLAAATAGTQGEVPVGAILCSPQGHLLGQCGNQMLKNHNPVGHAEIRILSLVAKRLLNYRLTACQLFVTLEPCPMCGEAIQIARVGKVTFLAGSCAVEKGEDEKNAMRRPSDGKNIALTPHPHLSSWSVALMQFFFEPKR